MGESLSREDFNALLERIGRRPYGRIEFHVVMSREEMGGTSKERELLVQLDVEYHEAYERTARAERALRDGGAEDLPDWREMRDGLWEGFERSMKLNRDARAAIFIGLCAIARFSPPAPIVIHVEEGGEEDRRV